LRPRVPRRLAPAVGIVLGALVCVALLAGGWVAYAINAVLP
jgi:hypothetical protein